MYPYFMTHNTDVVWIKCLCPPKPICWWLASSGIVFEGGACGKEWADMIMRVEAPWWGSAVVGGRGRSFSAVWGYREEMVTDKPERDPSPATKSGGTLILDFQSPELWKISIYCLSHQVCDILLQQPELRHEVFMKLWWGI